MEKQTIEVARSFVSSEERAQLVQFCARFTKHTDVAEDLAQETLLAAWRNEHTLRDAQRRGAWLFGIARNICLRWLHTHGRDTMHLVQPYAGQESMQPALEDVLADDFDIEVALERKDLIDLLDRALTLLPSETRTALIQHYVEESPLAEIAAQLGTNASAVAMRLQRGKLALRRVLTHEMGQEFAPYTLHASTVAWEVTPLWCYSCGQQRLLGQRDARVGKLLLKCPACNPGFDELLNRNNQLTALKGVSGYKPLYSRLAAWCDRYYRTALRDGSIACMFCGSMLAVAITMPERFPRWFRARLEMHMWLQYSGAPVVAIPCENCLTASITTLESLVLASAQGQHFLQAHPRLRTLPRQYLEVDGRATILTRFESVTSAARLDIISDAATYEVLRIYGEA